MPKNKDLQTYKGLHENWTKAIFPSQPYKTVS